MSRRRRRRTQFEESLINNQNSYAFYVQMLTNLAISRFKYTGLPDTVDQRYLELKLFENGSVVYFRDEVIGDLCLSVIPDGEFDCYGTPVRRRAYSGYNNYNRQLDIHDSVIIWNNYTHTNSVLLVEQYAKQLWQLDRTINVNMNAQKTPILISCDENEKLTMENAYKDYEGNMPVIFAYKSFRQDGVKTLSTGAPFISDRVYDIKAKLWNEVLTYLGISNQTVSKRAQVNTEEVTRSMGGVFGCRHSALLPRQQGVEKINKMFGTQITVEWNEDEMNALVEGVTEDVEIYD